MYPPSVAEVELQRDLLYEQEKGVCRTLQSYLQKLSVTPSTEWTQTQQHTAATAPSTGELRNYLSCNNHKPGSMTALKDIVKGMQAWLVLYETRLAQWVTLHNI